MALVIRSHTALLISFDPDSPPTSSLHGLTESQSAALSQPASCVHPQRRLCSHRPHGAACHSLLDRAHLTTDADEPMICATIPWLANGLVCRSIGNDAEDAMAGRRRISREPFVSCCILEQQAQLSCELWFKACAPSWPLDPWFCSFLFASSSNNCDCC